MVVGVRAGWWGVALAAALPVLAGCGGRGPAPVIRPSVAVFPVEVRSFALRPAEAAALHDHATAVLAASEAFAVLPRATLAAKLRRRPRRAERTCHALACQVKLGRALGAGMSLATRVTRNMLGQCDVFSFLYDLRQQVTDQSGRHRAATCDLEQLASAVSRVTCHIVEQRQRDLTRTAEPGLVVGGDARTLAVARPRRGCLARAALLWLEHKVEQLAASRPGRGERARQAWPQQLAERVMDLRREYDQIARYPAPQWSVAATCRTGRLYEILADKIAAAVTGDGAAAPGAPAEDPARARQLREAAEGQAAPFKQQAAQIYADCLTRAARQELDNLYIRQARERLRALDPAAAAAAGAR